MTDQNELIGDVLGGFVDLTPEHPAAQQLRDNVAALKANDAEEFDAITVEVLPGCIVRPNDVLVLTAGQAITHEHADRIKAELFLRLPGIADVVVLGGGVNIAGVYREDDET